MVVLKNPNQRVMEALGLGDIKRVMRATVILDGKIPRAVLTVMLDPPRPDETRPGHLATETKQYKLVAVEDTEGSQ